MIRHLSFTWALLSTVLLASPGMQGSTVNPIERNATGEDLTSHTLMTSEASPSSSFSPGQPDTSSLPPTTAAQTTEQQGLSPGEAAGVAVGTIAGVAAVGGGIFAGLKYSGRLGG